MTLTFTSADYARRVHALAVQPRRDPPPERVVAILREVARAHGVSVSEIIGERRRKPEVRARQDAMWRLRRMSWCGGHPPLQTIGKWLGGRDHTTVLHGIRAHEARQPRDISAAVYQGSA